jgi:hypothetical protein
MQGAMMLEADYFPNNSTHIPKVFHPCFRMIKELFMKIVIGMRGMMTTSSAKNTTLDFLVSP